MSKLNEAIAYIAYDTTGRSRYASFDSAQTLEVLEANPEWDLGREIVDLDTAYDDAARNLNPIERLILNVPQAYEGPMGQCETAVKTKTELDEDTFKKQVLYPTLYAYGDCNSHALSADRNLDYLANTPCSLDEWQEAMATAVPHGYNMFDANAVADRLAMIDGIHSCKFWIAREGSVCVYIDGPDAVLNKIVAIGLNDLNADECDRGAHGGGLRARLWWD